MKRKKEFEIYLKSRFENLTVVVKNKKMCYWEELSYSAAVECRELHKEACKRDFKNIRN